MFVLGDDLQRKQRRSASSEGRSLGGFQLETFTVEIIEKRICGVYI